MPPTLSELNARRLTAQRELSVSDDNLAAHLGCNTRELDLTAGACAPSASFVRRLFGALGLADPRWRGAR